MTHMLVGFPCKAGEREKLYTRIQSRLSNGKSSLCEDVFIFDVPLNLRFSGFNDLISNADELEKQDNIFESAIKRVMKQLVELGIEAEPEVIWQQKSLRPETYAARFAWDDTRFPRSKTIKEALENLNVNLTRIEADLRTKTAKLSELREKENASTLSGALHSRNLAEVLTPQIVSSANFISTEHLTTVVVCLSKGQENEWKNSYERLHQFVVPRSTEKLNVSDAEGNSLWLCVIFRKKMDEFRAAARAKHFNVRDFTYNAEDLEVASKKKALVTAEKMRLEAFVNRIVQVAFSDLFIMWIHLKAMRVYTEATLMFGVPANFAAFAVKPKAGVLAGKIYAKLTEAFQKHSSGMAAIFSRAVFKSANDNDDEDVHPFVIVPCNLALP